ncbi:hypothetical protein MTR67_051007 [Solanum verrucosum]|uniref:Uncharacterized protein n=1 Tax=Solanum verrucosum TaxID=315347 RepID=A0AAF0V3H7_SOLVR|nr:hypothetical protein MTR67_051007 [Solanum verrucosum]
MPSCIKSIGGIIVDLEMAGKELKKESSKAAQKENEEQQLTSKLNPSSEERTLEFLSINVHGIPSTFLSM